MELWYSEQASDWETQTLPIGNGALGATIFGGVARERLLINEKSLWTGGPGADPAYTGGLWEEPRPNALAEARRLIFDEGPQEPETIARLLGQPRRAYGDYQPFGELVLEGPQPVSVTKYRRSLNLGTAMHRVEFVADGIHYVRDCFASYPDRVIVVRVTADRPGAVSFITRFTTPHASTTLAVSRGRIALSGRLVGNGMAFEAQVAVRNVNGEAVDTADGVRVVSADSATVVLTAGTDYVHQYPSYRGEHPHENVTAVLDAALRRSDDELVDRHQRDHRELFDRVRIDLGQAVPTVPTDELLASYHGGSTAEERALEVLAFDYGRYLLIASSRAGSLPANLQGVWNAHTSPPWSSDYHPNINLQMNYWPADVTNLGETLQPLFDFIDNLRPRGRLSAQQMFEARGFVVHNETNTFDFTGVHDWSTAFWFPEAAAWLSRQLWEHYEFSLDEGFLRDRAYPVLREIAEFWLDVLVPDPRDGKLVVVPSFSPEHGPYTAGAAMSQQIVWDLFTNLLAAADVLGDDEDFLGDVAVTRDRLDLGVRIGRWGQLQEWKEDVDDQSDTHRHVSHLYALHPGSQISPRTTPEYAAAAEISLRARESGGNQPGWSRAWKTMFWARLLRGDEAFAALRDLLAKQTMPNLWDSHPPFQIDGNFGATAGVAQMLLQSHGEAIHVLPALPSAWPAGRFDGLRARGGFTLGATWSSGHVDEIRLTADHPRPAVVKYESHGWARVVDEVGEPVACLPLGTGTIRFDAVPDRAYVITI